MEWIVELTFQNVRHHTPSILLTFLLNYLFLRNSQKSARNSLYTKKMSRELTCENFSCTSTHPLRFSSCSRQIHKFQRDCHFIYWNWVATWFVKKFQILPAHTQYAMALARENFAKVSVTVTLYSGIGQQPDMWEFLVAPAHTQFDMALAREKFAKVSATVTLYSEIG